MKSIYRFNLSTVMHEKVSHFAKIHQHDDRHDFKEAWLKWLETNEIDIIEETKIQKGRGYFGDIEEMKTKMYVSARYYHRKKPPKQKEEKKRKEYERISVVEGQCIEQFINETIKLDTKPSISYRNYVEYIYRDLGEKEVKKELENNRMKKIYKNKFNRIKNVMSERTTK